MYIYIWLYGGYMGLIIWGLYSELGIPESCLSIPLLNPWNSKGMTALVFEMFCNSHCLNYTFNKEHDVVAA